MSKDLYHERYAVHRFYVADIYANGNIIVEVPGGRASLKPGTIKLPAVGDVGTCYCIGTGPDGSELLAYEPDLKEWGREARYLTKLIATAHRRADECIRESDWRGVVKAGMDLANAAAMLHTHYDKQP